MASPYQYTGIAYIRVDGREIPTKEGATFTPGGMNRDVVKGSRVYGWQQTAAEAIITCTIPQGDGLSLFSINNIQDATIEFECDTGERFLLANAWSDGRCSLTGKGEISATFNAREAREI